MYGLLPSTISRGRLRRRLRGVRSGRLRGVRSVNGFRARSRREKPKGTLLAKGDIAMLAKGDIAKTRGNLSKMGKVASSQMLFGFRPTEGASSRHASCHGSLLR